MGGWEDESRITSAKVGVWVEVEAELGNKDMVENEKFLEN